MTSLVRALHFLQAGYESLAWAVSIEGTEDHAPQVTAARGFIEAALQCIAKEPTP